MARELCDGYPFSDSRSDDSDHPTDVSAVGMTTEASTDSKSDAEPPQSAPSPNGPVLVNEVNGPIVLSERVTAAKLKEYCRNYGRSGYWKLKKADLIKKLANELPGIFKLGDGLQT